MLPDLRALLARDVDDQHQSPLAVVRRGAATIGGAQEVGKKIAERARAAGVTQVIFDRGGFLFHGRVKALADAAREGGLEF